jgi:hypothetical protein
VIPSEIRANFNLTITVEDTASSVPTGYTPKFVLGGAASLVKSGSVDGENVIFDFVPTDTINLASGQYWYQVVAENGTGDRIFIAEGTIKLIGKINGTDPYDGRSLAEKILEAIDATMLGKATRDQQSYTIQSGSGSRSLSRLSVTELIEAKKYYAGIVAAEKRAANGQPTFKRHKFSFVAD